jgi:hypothetical protein
MLINKSTNLKILYTAKDVAEILSIKPCTVYAYASAGIIHSIVLPRVRPSVAIKRNKRAIRFSVESIQLFLDNLGVLDGTEKEIK